jgi:hypothetical protein
VPIANGGKNILQGVLHVPNLERDLKYIAKIIDFG